MMDLFMKFMEYLLVVLVAQKWSIKWLLLKLPDYSSGKLIWAAILYAGQRVANGVRAQTKL